MFRGRFQRVSLYGSVSAAALAVLASPLGAMAQTSAPSAQAAAPDSVQAVVVTARRKALETATERKKLSDTIVDSIVADEAGKLPDTSITEVLQRVPGVTIDRFANLNNPDAFAFEGTGVQLRGLSQVEGLINGEEVDSANGGAGLNFEAIAPELMAAVDVYKEGSADLVEGGIGGAIDLRTRMPFDYKKPEFDFNLGATYGDFAQKLSPQGSLLATKRWETPIGDFGALVDLSYSQIYYADSNARTEPYYQESSNGRTVYVPGGFNYGNDEFNRTRKGAYLAFQWRPNSDLTIYQTDFVSNYHQANSSDGVFVDQDCCATPGANDVFNSKGVFQSGSIYYGTPAAPGASGGVGAFDGTTPSDSTTADFNQGFVWTPTQKLRVSGALQLVQSGDWSGEYNMGVGTSAAFYEEDLGNLNGKLPHWALPDANLTSPAETFPSFLQWNDTRNHAQQIAVNLDVDYDLGEGFFRDVKVGVRYQARDEKDSLNGTFFAPTDPGFSPNGPASLTVTTAPPGDFQLTQLPNFFKGGTSVPSAFWQYTQDNPGALEHTLETYATGLGYNDTFGNPPADRHTKEQTSDAYVEVKFGHDWAGWLPPFTGNVGVRVVHNEVQSSGSFTVNGGDPFYESVAAANAAYQAAGGAAAIAANPTLVSEGVQELTPSTSIRTGDKQYTYALPDINFAFRPNEQWIIRFAFDQTLSQPNFTDISTYGTVSAGSKSTNPNQAALSAYVLSTNGPTAAVPQLASVITNLTDSAGNTKLNPAVSTNEDISIEWYPKSSTTAHIDVFNKSIRNEILYNNNTIATTVPTNLGPYTGVVQSISDYNSTKIATLTGVEFGARTYFDMLPGALKGIGVEGNYTIINSHSPGAYATGMDGNVITGLPIALLSNTSYNMALLYDLGKWDVRLAYNWRSKYLITTTDVGLEGSYTSPITGQTINYSLPNYAAATGQLDAHISYKVNDHITVGFDGANLLNAINRTLQETVQGEFETRSWFMNDVRYSLSLNAKF